MKDLRGRYGRKNLNFPWEYVHPERAEPGRILFHPVFGSLDTIHSITQRRRGPYEMWYEVTTDQGSFNIYGSDDLMLLPYRPVSQAVRRWNDSTVPKLAMAARRGQWGNMPILADALEEAGCDDQEMLDVLRSGSPMAIYALAVLGL